MVTAARTILLPTSASAAAPLPLWSTDSNTSASRSATHTLTTGAGSCGAPALSIDGNRYLTVLSVPAASLPQVTLTPVDLPLGLAVPPVRAEPLDRLPGSS